MMGAYFSEDRKRRYLLWRDLRGDGPVMSIGMINPSNADEEKNDRTITRIINFAERENCSKVYVWNLCSAITPYVKELKNVIDPVGVDNDAYISAALISSQVHVVAWGPVKKLPLVLHNRRFDVLKLANQINVNFQCWDVAKDGQPKHPLMLSGSLPLRPWLPV